MREFAGVIQHTSNLGKFPQNGLPKTNIYNYQEDYNFVKLIQYAVNRNDPELNCGFIAIGTELIAEVTLKTSENCT